MSGDDASPVEGVLNHVLNVNTAGAAGSFTITPETEAARQEALALRRVLQNIGDLRGVRVLPPMALISESPEQLEQRFKEAMAKSCAEFDQMEAMLGRGFFQAEQEARVARIARNEAAALAEDRRQVLYKIEEELKPLKQFCQGADAGYFIDHVVEQIEALIDQGLGRPSRSDKPSEGGAS